MRRISLYLTLLVAVLLSACATPTPATPPVSVAEQNLAVVRRIYDGIASGDKAAITETHANPFTLNYPGGAEEVDPALFAEDLIGIKGGVPDLHAEVQDMYASGDMVVTQLTWTGTHSGELFGVPGTGKTFTHNGVVVRLLKDGKVIESWETFDDFEFFHSIGYLPSWDEFIAQGPQGQPTPAPVAEALVRLTATKTEDIAGMWQGRGGAPGDPPILWRFEADGTYRLAFTEEQFADGFFIERGTYTFDGAKLSLVPEQNGCAPEIGIYVAQITKKGDLPPNLTMIAVDDPCPNRKTSLAGPMPMMP